MTLPKMVTYLITSLDVARSSPVSLSHSPEGVSWDHFPSKPLTLGQLLRYPNVTSQQQPRSLGLFYPLSALALGRCSPSFQENEAKPCRSCPGACPQGRKERGGRLGKKKSMMLLRPTCALFKAGGMKFSHIKF